MNGFDENGRENGTREAGAALLNLAREQMRRAFIPTVVAVVASVLINRIGSPLIVLGVLAAIGWGWWCGWRVRLVRTK